MAWNGSSLGQTAIYIIVLNQTSPQRISGILYEIDLNQVDSEPAKHFFNSAIDQSIITVQQRTCFSVQIWQKLAQTHYANFLTREYTVNTRRQEKAEVTL